MKNVLTDPLTKDILNLLTPWWGKLLGLFVGYFIAGPAGSVFGVLIGNLFDKKLFNYIHTPEWYHYRQAPQEVKNVFYSSLFQIMGHLAKTDGHIASKDIEIARKIMREMRLYGAVKRRAMEYYNQGKASTFNLGSHLRLIKQVCYHNPPLRALFAETLYRTALIKPISNAKKQRLNVIFNLLGFKILFPELNDNDSNAYENGHDRRHSHQSHYQHQSQSSYSSSSYQRRTTSNKPMDDYAILGVSHGERAAIIKKAYRKIMSQTHPDKLIARGASKQEIQAATERAQQVRAAYERLKKARGF